MADAVPQHINVDVTDIERELADRVEVVTDIWLDALVLGDITFDPHGPAHVDVAITNAGTGLVAEGTVSVDLDTVCVRCLRRFVLHVSGSVEGFYVQHGTEHELPEEQEYAFVEHGTVDILPAVREAVSVELPFSPLHDPACVGLCPTCGADLTQGACGCPSPVTDSPFAVLEGLFEHEEDGPQKG